MTSTPESTPTWLDLYDYRERVARLYRERDAALRAGEDGAANWARWRMGRDTLFARHPQSALDPSERASFAGLRYFPYDPAYRVEAALAPETGEQTDELPSSAAMRSTGAHSALFRRAGRLTFTLDGAPAQLIIYWIDVYGGGLFLPFRDATSGTETYGAGRYLFDTVKGSDFMRLGEPLGEPAGDGAMGYAGGHVLLDFNYAYNPSCSYDARWACPLAPAENRLPMPIRAGEMLSPDHPE
jgi:uncharacterized protein